jgi:hypothetical protein
VPSKYATILLAVPALALSACGTSIHSTATTTATVTTTTTATVTATNPDAPPTCSALEGDVVRAEMDMKTVAEEANDPVAAADSQLAVDDLQAAVDDARKASAPHGAIDGLQQILAGTRTIRSGYEAEDPGKLIAGLKQASRGVTLAWTHLDQFCHTNGTFDGANL